jgi:hypothetical protein
MDGCAQPRASLRRSAMTRPAPFEFADVEEARRVASLLRAPSIEATFVGAGTNQIGSLWPFGPVGISLPFRCAGDRQAGQYTGTAAVPFNMRVGHSELASLLILNTLSAGRPVCRCGSRDWRATIFRQGDDTAAWQRAPGPPFGDGSLMTSLARSSSSGWTAVTPTAAHFTTASFPTP